MSENVLRLTPEEPDADEPEVAVAGVDVAFVIGLADNRQMQMRTTFLQDTPAVDMDVVLDRLMARADRLAARQELRGLRKDLAKHEKMLRQQVEDMERLDQQHAVKIAELETETETLQKDARAVHDAGQAAHERSGKQAPYEPKGHVLGRLGAIDAQLRKIMESKGKAAAEREVAQQNLATSMKRFEEEIAVIKADIAEREALLKG